MRRLLAIAMKEVLHIQRDPRTLFVAIMMPMAMLMLYGYAIDMDLKHVRIGVFDNDHTRESRELVERIIAGNTFIVTDYLHDRSQFADGFAANKYRAVLAIEPGYARDITANKDASFQVIVDGSDANSANNIANDISAVAQQLSRERIEQRFGKKMDPPIELRTRIWYNEELKSAVFIVPGLVALFLVMVCALLTSVAITREKEYGTLEQILTTPVHPVEVIIGKVLPYLAIAILDATLTIAIGHYFFLVPIRGSLIALSIYSLLYLVIALAIGLVISVMVRTQQVALMIALTTTLLPTLLLSGLVFPVSSMPLPLQMLSKVVPASWFIPIVRGIMLRGENWFPLDTAVLVGMAAILLTWSVLGFRKIIGKGV